MLCYVYFATIKKKWEDLDLRENTEGASSKHSLLGSLEMWITDEWKDEKRTPGRLRGMCFSSSSGKRRVHVTLCRERWGSFSAAKGPILWGYPPESGSAAVPFSETPLFLRFFWITSFPFRGTVLHCVCSNENAGTQSKSESKGLIALGPEHSPVMWSASSLWAAL